MPTTIDPPLGEAPLFVAGGVATTTGYSAIDLRLALGVALQEGAVEALAYKVMQRLSGAAMFVEIDADAGSCVVQGDFVTGQGLYPVPPHSANIEEAIAAADVTNPRIDQVVLEVLDNVHDASGGNLARVRVIAGTPSPGATLDNRTGAAALPGSCVRLADVLVGAGVTSIVTANIRDRRPWARGVFNTVNRVSADYTTTGISYAIVDSTNLNVRVECTGSPLRVALHARVDNSGAFNTLVHPRVDGAIPAELGSGGDTIGGSTGAAWWVGSTFGTIITPAAGSHLISLYWRVTGGTGTLRASSTNGMVFSIEEVVRQNASNG